MKTHLCFHAQSPWNLFEMPRRGMPRVSLDAWTHFAFDLVARSRLRIFLRFLSIIVLLGDHPRSFEQFYWRSDQHISGLSAH